MMRFVPWLGCDIACCDEGDGPPVVFLHGRGTCAAAWYQQIAALRNTYRVIAIDSVNHGASSNSPVDAEEPDRVDELDTVLSALGVVSPVVVGQSMGGITALRWALRYPGVARGLVISGIGVPTAAELTEEPDISEPIDPRLLVLPVGNGGFTAGFRAREPMQVERYSRLRSTSSRLEAERRPRRRSSSERHDLEAMAGSQPLEIDAPVLVIVGSEDHFVSRARRLHARIAGSQYREISNVLHSVNYEAWRDYNDALITFLKDVDKMTTDGMDAASIPSS